MAGFMDSFAVEERYYHDSDGELVRATVFHGDGGCSYVYGSDDFSEEDGGRTFVCANCRRRICYCGGHCGQETEACPANCEKCDECCTGADEDEV